MNSTATPPLRLAMWSGPRNISTAMMRAWENRADTAVVDEPFYAYYLQATGDDHPGKAEVIADGETDWRRVIAQLTSDVPDARPIFYQKQMTHHLLPEVDREWLLGLTNCFLIRDPREVIHSYVKKNHTPTVADLGFVQQAEIFDFLRAATGATPPVIDAREVLENPRRMLQRVCATVGVAFDEAMLSWPPGLRATDGIWAKHWYTEVERSTSFRAYAPQNVEVPEHLRAVHDECRAIYHRLRQHRLT